MARDFQNLINTLYKGKSGFNIAGINNNIVKPLTKAVPRALNNYSEQLAWRIPKATQAMPQHLEKALLEGLGGAKQAIPTLGKTLLRDAGVYGGLALALPEAVKQAQNIYGFVKGNTGGDLDTYIDNYVAKNPKGNVLADILKARQNIIASKANEATLNGSSQQDIAIPAISDEQALINAGLDPSKAGKISSPQVAPKGSYAPLPSYNDIKDYVDTQTKEQPIIDNNETYQAPQDALATSDLATRRAQELSDILGMDKEKLHAMLVDDANRDRVNRSLDQISGTNGLFSKNSSPVDILNKEIDFMTKGYETGLSQQATARQIQGNINMGAKLGLDPSFSASLDPKELMTAITEKNKLANQLKIQGMKASQAEAIARILAGSRIESAKIGANASMYGSDKRAEANDMLMLLMQQMQQGE